MQGDCLERMKELEDNSIDAVVTDPPYGLAFMGKRWDYDVPSVDIWRECLRVLKPGGYLLAFAGTRTQHRMAVNIEDAGFEIRDMIAWVYGSGFPKSHNVSKGIDRAKGLLQAESTGFTVAGYSHAPDKLQHTAPSRGYIPPKPKSEAAKQWEGWGTALKPALEPVTVARKPFAGTVADNVLQHGTGAINIDACRIETEDGATFARHVAPSHFSGSGREPGEVYFTGSDKGRWPANLIHDGSDEVLDVFPDDSARFFYCAKAQKDDRDAGLSRATTSAGQKTNRKEGSAGITPYTGTRVPTRNNHPTVKPVSLMRYLCRLVTQPGGVVLDPFMGSGTTGRACLEEGFAFVGIERDPEYFQLCKERMNRVQLPLFGGA